MGEMAKREKNGLLMLMLVLCKWTTAVTCNNVLRPPVVGEMECGLQGGGM